MNDIQSSDAIFKNLGLATQRDQAPKDDSLGQEQFLELMVAQVRNQDPFKPLENGEFLSQIAQFSQVSGIQELQNSFSQFANSLGSNQALQASALVGREVFVPGDTAVYNPGQAFNGVVELSQSTSDLTVSVVNSAGETVRTVPMGTQQAGSFAFNWDGSTDAGSPAPAGVYKVVAEANIDGEKVAVGTLVADKVDSVTIGRAGQGTILNLSSLGSVGLADVREIR